MKRTTLLTLLMLLLVGAVTAAIYKWVDEEGKVHYGDRPTHKAEQIETAPGPSEKEIQRSQERTERLIHEQKRREEPQEVLGTMYIGFFPTVLAVMPEPPIELTLLIKPVGRDAPIKHRITDPSATWVVEGGSKQKFASSHQNFKLSLRPGRYVISEVLAQVKSLTNKPFTLAYLGPTFTVPEANCVYVGRIGYTYVRLPPGSASQAKAAVEMMAEKKGKKRVIFMYLTTGALVPLDGFVDELKKTDLTHGNEILAEAREKKCITKLARF